MGLHCDGCVYASDQFVNTVLALWVNNKVNTYVPKNCTINLEMKYSFCCSSVPRRIQHEQQRMGTRDLQQIGLTDVAAVGVSSDWNSDHVAASSNIVAPVTSIQVDGCSIKLVILVMHLKLCMEKWFSELLVCILFCRSSAWCILTVLKTRLEVQLFEEEFGRFKKIMESV